MVQPVLIYRSETWVFTKKHFGLLNSKVLWTVVDPVFKKARYQRRCNHELNEICQEEDFAKKIKARKSFAVNKDGMDQVVQSLEVQNWTV